MCEWRHQSWQSFNLGWEFQFLVPISGTPIVSGIPIPFSIPKIPAGFFFWNSDVWRVRKLEFRFAIIGIPVISLRRNSVRLIVANLYWLQSMYNDLILIVHKLVAPLQHQTADQHHVISWHCQCNRCHWPAILDRWCNWCHWCASGKNKGDIEQEIVILSQLLVINVQRLCDLDHLAVRWNTTDICSICQGECESILIEMEMMAKMGTPVPYGSFLLTNLKFKMWLYLKMLIDMETPLTNSNCPPPLSTAMVRKLTCLLFQYNNLI